LTLMGPVLGLELPVLGLDFCGSDFVSCKQQQQLLNRFPVIHHNNGWVPGFVLMDMLACLDNGHNAGVSRTDRRSELLSARHVIKIDAVTQAHTVLVFACCLLSTLCDL